MSKTCHSVCLTISNSVLGLAVVVVVVCGKSMRGGARRARRGARERRRMKQQARGHRDGARLITTTGYDGDVRNASSSIPFNNQVSC